MQKGVNRSGETGNVPRFYSVGVLILPHGGHEVKANVLAGKSYSDDRCLNSRSMPTATALESSTQILTLGVNRGL